MQTNRRRCTLGYLESEHWQISGRCRQTESVPSRSKWRSTCVGLLEQRRNLAFQSRQIHLYDFPHDVVLHGCVTVNNLVSERDNFLGKRNPDSEVREIAKQLRKRFPDDAEFAFDRRTQQLILTSLTSTCLAYRTSYRICIP